MRAAMACRIGVSGIDSRLRGARRQRRARGCGRCGRCRERCVQSTPSSRREPPGARRDRGRVRSRIAPRAVASAIARFGVDRLPRRVAAARRRRRRTSRGAPRPAAASTRSPRRPRAGRPASARPRGCAACRASRLSISSVAFSPSSRNSASPGRTASPSAFSHSTNVPSSMFQPSRGIVTGIGIDLTPPAGRESRSTIACRVRHDGGLQRRAVRRRRVQRRSAGGSARRGRRSRGRRPAPRSPRRCRTARTPRPRSAAGPVFATERQDRLDVERRDRPRVDHLDRDALASPASRTPSSVCGTIRASATTVTSLALAHDRRLAELDLVVVLRHRPLDARAARDARGTAPGRRSAARGAAAPWRRTGVDGHDDAQAGEVGVHAGSSCRSGASPPSGRCRCSRAAGPASSAGRCDMYCILAIWLTISPTPSRTKSANMKSIDRPRAGHRRAARRGRRSRARRSACRTAARGRTARTARRSSGSCRRARRCLRPGRRSPGSRPSRPRALRASPAM